MRRARVADDVTLAYLHEGRGVAPLAAARKAGVEAELRVWPEMIHVWHAFADLLPEGQAAVEEMAAFLEERLA